MPWKNRALNPKRIPHASDSFYFKSECSWSLDMEDTSLKIYVSKYLEFIKAALCVSALNSRFGEIMCPSEALRVCSLGQPQCLPQTVAAMNSGPLSCRTDRVSKPEWRWASQSHSPGAENCDRKLNYSWTVSVNADTNRWHCVALGTEEAALWKIIDREFCWSLTGFPVLGSSHSREPAVLGYIITHCMLSRFSHVWHFVTPWTVAYQAPLSMGILQASILGWVAMPSSRGSSRPRDQTRICYVSCESLLEIPF